MSGHSRSLRADLAVLGGAAARPPSTPVDAWRPTPGEHHLVHVFPNFDVGGAQVRLVQLAESLGDRFRHTVVSLGGRFEAAALFGPDAKVRLVAAPADAGRIPSRLAAYRRLLAGLRPDLLLTYNWGSIEFAAANLFAGAAHLHLEDGFGPDEAQAQLKRRVWTRRLLLRGSQLAVPSRVLHRIAVDVWRLDAARVHHLPNGVAPRSEFRTSLRSLDLGLPADRPTIAWAGALRAEKNPLRLLRAFAPLGRRAVLLVIGDGPQRAVVEEAVREMGLGESVRLLGRRDDARDLIMQSDVLALSSDTEQMPLVVLEAMDAGLPVASTRVGDVAEMVARENRPFVVEPSDEALGQALDRLVREPGLRRSVGASNRDRARRTYPVGEMARAHRALIASTIAGRGSVG